MNRFRRYLASRHGATAIEYALVAGMISIVIVAAASRIGSSMINLFYNNLTTAF